MKTVSFYVCPTEGCTSYYGSSNMGNMEQIVGTHDANFGPKPEAMHHTRSECPDCRSRGDKVTRKRVTLVVDDEFFVDTGRVEVQTA